MSTEGTLPKGTGNLSWAGLVVLGKEKKKEGGEEEQGERVKIRGGWGAEGEEEGWIKVWNGGKNPKTEPLTTPPQGSKISLRKGELKTPRGMESGQGGEKGEFRKWGGGKSPGACGVHAQVLKLPSEQTMHLVGKKRKDPVPFRKGRVFVIRTKADLNKKKTWGEGGNIAWGVINKKTQDTPKVGLQEGGHLSRGLQRWKITAGGGIT